MPSWSSDSRFGKSLDEQKRDRDQRYRDARAEASKDYLADIASDGPDCEEDERPQPYEFDGIAPAAPGPLKKVSPNNHAALTFTPELA